MGMSQPAVTKNAERLLEAGLIEVSRGEADRRQRLVSLSAAGRRTLDRSKREVWPMVEAAVKEITDDLAGPLVDQIAELEARLATRPLSNRAATFRVPYLVAAADEDVPAIAALMNTAYRGTGSDAGWTTESDCIDGDRASEALLREELLANPDAAFLLWRVPPSGTLLGCVWVEPQGDGIWYLGSLAIDPPAQNGGLGRTLLAAAEDWIRERGGQEVRMTVVNVRESLLAWYARRGYLATSETKPFPYGDNRFGIPKREDLHFVVLRKLL